MNATLGGDTSKEVGRVFWWWFGGRTCDVVHMIQTIMASRDIYSKDEIIGGGAYKNKVATK